jgi:peptidyl-Asp metalloendopeptidase
MKNNVKELSLVVVTIIFVAVVWGIWNFSPQTGAQSRAPLFAFKETPKVVTETEKSSIASVRESEIAINFQSLSETENETLIFPLFDGKSYQAKRSQTEFRATNDFTWRGRIRQEKFDGDVILTFRNGFMSGLIYAPDAVYEILPKGARHILIELDQRLFPECGGEIKSDEKPNSLNRENALASVDSGDRIDVLVVYTTATKNVLGGDAQAQTLAQQAVDAANTAYINSKIRQRVRMVHTQEYLYTESGNSSTDLSNLRNNATIQNLRNTHNADLVAMIGEVTGVCGVGYLMGTAQGGNPNNGFTVTTRSCAVGNLSFAHELGHNMGSQHNPENGSNATYPYGYGHYVNSVFRTVMSYVDPCPNGCTRRAYFSNPEVFYNGYATGLDNARDNARSINNTADSIANYRYSGANLMMNNFNGGEALPRGIARALTWSSENVTGNVRIEISRDESTNWQTVIASTPNDGSENVTVWGRATRRARLRVVSLDNPTVSDSSVRNISIR